MGDGQRDIWMVRVCARIRTKKLLLNWAWDSISVFLIVFIPVITFSCVFQYNLKVFFAIWQAFKATLSMLLKPGEKTYTQRCRLFIGNLPNDITEDDFKKLFAKYGEPSEVFINKIKGFGFIRLVSHHILKCTHVSQLRILNNLRSSLTSSFALPLGQECNERVYIFWFKHDNKLNVFCKSINIWDWKE